jgi:hypothetical protein
VTILSGWREQYDRMGRSLDRLTRAATGIDHASSDDARDLLFHFFQDAYHLKDWIKNDLTTLGRDVEDFINGSTPLSLCADLCNGTKHFRLTTTRTGDVATGFESQSVTVRPAPVGSGRIAAPALHSWTVMSGGRDHDALALAGEVAAEWRAWLMKQGLA